MQDIINIICWYEEYLYQVGKHTKFQPYLVDYKIHCIGNIQFLVTHFSSPDRSFLMNSMTLSLTTADLLLNMVVRRPMTAAPRSVSFCGESPIYRNETQRAGKRQKEAGKRKKSRKEKKEQERERARMRKREQEREKESRNNWGCV